MNVLRFFTTRAVIARVALILALALIVGSLAQALPARAASSSTYYFPQTGFSVDDVHFQDFFAKRGGARTFGYPVSRVFTLQGFPVQIFQRAVMQRYPDGHVQLLNLLDAGLFPYTQMNGATFPAVDDALVATAPAPGSPDYGNAILRWIQQTSPDVWHGLHVDFHETFMNTVATAVAFPNGSPDPGLVAGFDLEVWGIPTSAPTPDPNNGNFVYQRFQRGILHFDATTGATQGVLLADYFKSILTGKNLPSDLASAAKNSPYFAQYNPAKAGSVDRPADLPSSDLTNAFDQVPIAPPAGTQAAPTAASASTVPAAPVNSTGVAAPATGAYSVAIIDEASGALIYSKDPHRAVPPASTTKVFTSLVALRYGQLNQQITVQFDNTDLSDSTLMGIHPGEVYSLEDLLYGLLLPSGNDAALAIAIGIGGSVPKFVSMMNAEAADLGLHDSHFVNPHGLDDPNHYVSAYDLGMAARYGMMNYPEFRKIVIARTWTAHGTRSIPLYNLNRLLWTYSGADGVKPGFTDNAGKTIAASATRNGHRVYVVSMHYRTLESDVDPLFDWVFDNFAWPTS